MRATLGRSLGLVGALLAFAVPAFGGTFTGQLSLIVGGLPPVGVSGAGTGVSSVSAVSVPAGAFAATGASAPGTTSFVSRVLVTAANGAGAFAGTPLGGTMPVGGKVRLLQGGFTAFSIPLTQSGTRGVGVGGAPIVAGTPSSEIALQGAGWTAGTASLTGIGVAGNLRTFALKGSDARTANGAGTLTLVTPIRISHSTLGSVAAFGVLRLTFAPEPEAALLGAAAGALLALGVRRSRRS
jgi:hypothetical protein